MATLAMLALAGLWVLWLLGTESGRMSLIGHVASRLETATGWQLEAGQSDLGGEAGAGRIELTEIRLGAPGEAPVLRVDRVVALLELRPLLRGELVVRKLELVEPIIDLEAPRPVPQSQPTPPEPVDEGPLELPLEITEWRIESGAAENGPGRGWLSSFAVHDLSLAGSLVGSAVDARLEKGQIVIERAADDELLPFALAGQVRGAVLGPWTVDRLEIDGEDALDLLLTGTFGLPGQPSTATFKARLDPSLLVPEIDPGQGLAELDGRFALPSGDLSLDVETEDFPVALLEPFVSESAFAALGKIDRLDLEAELESKKLAPEDTHGRAELVLKGAEVIAHAHVNTAAAEPGEVALEVDLRLLPEEPGVAELSGRLVAPGWRQLANGRVEGGRLDFRQGRLGRFRDRIHEIWPQSREALASVPEGRIELEVEAAGALEDPRGEFSLQWFPELGGELRVAAKASRRNVEARIELVEVDPGVLVPVDVPLRGAWDGVLEVGGDSPLRVQGEIRAGLLEFTPQGAEESDKSPRLEEVEVGITADLPWREELASGPVLDRPATVRVETRVGLVESPDGSVRDLASTLSLDGPLDPSRIEELLRSGLGLEATAEEVRGSEIELADLRLRVSSQQGGFNLNELQGLLKPPEAVGIDQLPFKGHGQVRFREEGELTLGDMSFAEIELDAGDATRDVAGLIKGRIADGRLSFRIPTFTIDGAVASGGARIEVPIRQALEIPGLDVPALRQLAGDSGVEKEPIIVAFDLASVDLRGFERWTGEALPAASGDLRGLLRFEPGAPSGAVGRLVLDSARFESPRGVLETDGPMALRLGEHRAELRPSRLRFDDRHIEATGHLELRPGWRFEEPVADLLERFALDAEGALDVGLLEENLPDCRAEGVVEFILEAAGDLESHRGALEIRGDSDAAFTWDRPYVTRFSSPEAHIRVEDGEVFIDSFQAKWNEGQLGLTGRVGETIDVQGELAEIRYRLDYGLAVLMGGTFRYRNSPEPGRLEADLVVDRGTLRRRIDAGQQVLDVLLAPPTLERGGGTSAIDETELAIRIRTEDGVRVKNNLADLRIGWAPLAIEGTAAAPQITGTLEADPDGRVYAYGQVIRLDRAALIFEGAPGAGPRLDLQMTTSLEDPSLLTPEDQRVLASLASDGDDFEALRGSERSARVRESVASGLTTYFGDRLAARLGRALGRTQLRYRPLWIFGEADPEARLVLSRDISRFASVGIAFDLRQADEQTYLLELGRFPRLPRFSGTLFSDDEAQLGATFQQRLTFGGGARPEQETRPEISKIRIDCPTCVSFGRKSPKQLAGRALSWRRGRPIDLGAGFDLEIEVAERLRRGGFPDPEVKVEIIETAPDRVELEVALEPGPRAEFLWLGEEPPRSRQETMRDLYRSDYSERASLAEIEQTAKRVWRSRGHPWPEVSVQVEVKAATAEDGPPAGTRLVKITSEPGESFELGAPRFTGLPTEVAAELARRFFSQQARAELIAGEGTADARLETALLALGYPAAKVVGREFDAADPFPHLTIEPGPRRFIADLEITGMPVGEESRLQELMTIEAGAPLIGAELAEAAFALEKDLRERGWADARVRLRVPAPPAADAAFDEVTWGADVALEIEPGQRQKLAQVEIRGADVTRESWVERLAGVEEKRGEWLDATEVTEARRRLLETRLFDRVQVDVETDESGQAKLTFDLRERHRYLAAYGLRWEESEGLGALVDVLDRNAGGRAIGLGLRALWLSDRRSLRLYSQFPRLLNSPLELELFVEAFDEEEDGLFSDGFELSAQLKWPLSRRTELRSYVRYRRADVRDESLLLTPEEEQESIPLLGFQVVHDRRDDPFDPRRGFFASADLSGSEDIVTSDESYVRLFAQVDTFLPLGPRWTWAQGARVGYADVFSGELPRDVRFFAGGARSLRGYASRSIGPQEDLADGDQRAAGGEALLVLHEELRYDVTEAIQGVLFFDTGNVWEEAEDLGEDLLSGVGLGVRYRSPIGLLRLDFAYPLDRREEDDEVEVYIGLGHAF